MFLITVTYDNESLHRIYGPTYIYPHALTGRVQLSPTPESLEGYEVAQSMFFKACDWLDAAMHEDDRADSTVTLRGPDGIFRSCTMKKNVRGLSLAKPAHPNLFTNA